MGTGPSYSKGTPKTMKISPGCVLRTGNYSNPCVPALGVLPQDHPFLMRKAVKHLVLAGIFSLSMSQREPEEQSRKLSHGPAQGWFIFRNGRAPQMDCSGNKGGCRSNHPGSPRHRCGTITAKFISCGTLGAANCPRFIKLTRFN